MHTTLLVMTSSLTIGHPLPPLDLTTPSGKPSSLAALARPHTVTVVNFWATWCPPCRAELPLLLRASRQGQVRIITVNVGENPQRVQAFLAREKLTELPVYYASSQTLARLTIPGLPATLALNGRGQLTDRVYGPLTAQKWSALLRRVQP